MTLASNSTNDRFRKQDCVEYITNVIDAQVEQIITGAHPTKLPYLKQVEKFNEVWGKAIAAGLTPFDLFHICARQSVESLDEDYRAWRKREAEAQRKNTEKLRKARARKKQIIQLPLKMEGA